MTPERWKQIEALYHSARALPAAERSAWLASSCPNDQELQREVERLLSQPSSDEGFLAGHARDVAAGLATQHPALVAKTLGGYEMQALIGVGGMGEVYRAKDLKLGREVAIKVLPHAFTSDPGRLARFDREARTLAALNHPNICAIHGFEHAGEIRFLVLELVGGDTLAERLQASRAGAGAPGLPQRDALHIARQIARALHFAHEHGIVHRDLKPANIKVTADGGVKVLDFGLAKATVGDAAGADLEPAPNVTHDGTIEGALLGTPAYMSPEQARGKPVDKRTDIWAFGCVLYEMLTGRVAFHGDTLADTIAKVIERAPDWSALPRSTPEPIKNLLLACLAKDSRERLQDIDDVTIENILSGSASGTKMAPAALRQKRRTPWLTYAAAAALVAGSAWGVWRFGPWPAPHVIEQTLTLPAGQVLDGSGGAHMVKLSRDATHLAYVASPRLLYLWPLTRPGAAQDPEARPVPGTQRFTGMREVEFSPDGKDVAFYSFADQALMRMSVRDSSFLKISDARTPTGIHWGPNGVVLYGQGRDGIWLASVNAQGARRIAEVNQGEEAHGPWLLPDNHHYLYTIAKGRTRDRWDSARIVVRSLNTEGLTELQLTGSDARYLSTGHLIYAVSGRLWAVPFDPNTLKVQGNAVAVLEGVRRASGSATGAAHFSISDNGTLAYVQGLVDATPPLVDIAIVEDPTGKNAKPRKLKGQPDRYESLRVSPNGLTVAAGVEDDKGAAVIYTIPTNGGTSRQRRTPLDSDSRYPAWTHDSRRFAFQSNRKGDLGIWWQAADGTDEASRLTTAASGEEHIPESWSPDRTTLLYSVTINGIASLRTMTVRNGTPGKSEPFGRQTSTDPMSATFSPDGKAVAYTRTEKGDITVCVEPFPSQFQVECLPPNLGDSPKHPRWSPDGKHIYYDPRPGDFESVEVVRLEPVVQFGKQQSVPYHPFMLSPPATRTSYDVDKNGRFVGMIPAGRAEYQLTAKPLNTVVVVWNWFETLKRKFK